MIDMKDISGKIFWTKGYEAGVEAERQRIISVFYRKEEKRNIIDRLAFPYIAQELHDTILEGQE